jgi:hypothetical protein
MDVGWWLLIGVIIGVLGQFGGRIIYEWYMRPRIDIQEDEPQEGEGFVRHSIRIANNGRIDAKNCHGLLTIENMKKYEVLPHTKAYITKDNYRPVKDEPLCWAFQGRGPDDTPINLVFLLISPKSSRLLELCYADKASQIIFPSEMGWDRVRVALLADKEYIVEIKIFAENVQYDPKKHSKKFKLIPDVKTSELRVKSE